MTPVRTRRLSQVNTPTTQRLADVRPQTLRRSVSALNFADLKPLHNAMDEAKKLLDAGQPKPALEILAPWASNNIARTTVSFQGKLGNAYYEMAEHLVETNQIGHVRLQETTAGDAPSFQIDAERLSCYIGAMGGYGRFLRLLNHEEQRAKFVRQEGEETLRVVQGGLRHGLGRSLIGAKQFLLQIFQVNSNQASRSYVAAQLASGRWTESDPFVLSFREAEAMPLYAQIATATESLRAHAEQSEDGAHTYWLNWAEQEEKRLFNMPEVTVALSVFE